MTAINFSSTSSGPDGYSSQKLWLICSGKAALKTEEEAKFGKQTGIWPETDDEPVATAVGTIYGKLCQMYHCGESFELYSDFRWDDVSIEATHPKTCAEARRLFTAHREFYKREQLGEIVAVEESIEIPESLFGIRMTGSIDLVVKRPDGIWIDDFKTDGRNQNLAEKYSLEHQLWNYALGYELKTGIKPVGVRINCCVKTKTPQFIPLAYEGLTEQRFQWIKLMFDELKLARSNPRPQPSLNACKPWSTACKHLGENFVCKLIKQA